MTDLREAAQNVVDVWNRYGTAKSLRGWMGILEAALEQPEQADPVALEKLLHQVIYGDFNADNTDDLKLALAARKEFAALQPRRLTDDQIGQIWFAARIPGLTESDARRLIRAAEEAR